MGMSNRSDFGVFLVVMLVGGVVLAIGFYAGVPLLATLSDALSEGLTLKQAVPWGFGLTLAVLAFLAMVAGDGLIGEIQFLLGAFFGFFVLFTFLIAWVF